MQTQRPNTYTINLSRNARSQQLNPVIEFSRNLDTHCQELFIDEVLTERVGTDDEIHPLLEAVYSNTPRPDYLLEWTSEFAVGGYGKAP